MTEETKYISENEKVISDAFQNIYSSEVMLHVVSELRNLMQRDRLNHYENLIDVMLSVFPAFNKAKVSDEDGDIDGRYYALINAMLNMERSNLDVYNLLYERN